jgi:hypothetical protein
LIIPNAPAVSEMSEGLSTIPEAAYNLRVHKAEYVAVPKGKDAKGPYIKCQLIVTGPGDTPMLGRLVFMNYSLTGDGSFRLRELLAITGHPDDFRLTDSDELLGLEFGASVTLEKGTGGYPDKNVVKKHVGLLPTP